ncbi:hypothetical protein SO802_016772 [Lithocarpus litseifolius]|uniref:Remorin C-terminal domain-containing protein n=1 Tax=Lithocarpus litseifolius TaxID=425828 RepID=A0AAW2D2U6_9ROSI
MESQSGSKALEKTTQAKIPLLHPLCLLNLILWTTREKGIKEVLKQWNEGRVPSLRRPSFSGEAVQAAYRAKEIVISSHKEMKEEEGRRVAAVKAFELAKKKSQDLNAKLVEADRDKKNAEATLDRGRALSVSSFAKLRMSSPLLEAKSNS